MGQRSQHPVATSPLSHGFRDPGRQERNQNGTTLAQLRRKERRGPYEKLLQEIKRETKRF